MRFGGRKTWFVGLFIAIAVAAVATYSFVATKKPRRRSEIPLLDGSTETVVPGVHLLGGIGPSAAYAIETPLGIVLIDSGLETDAGPVRVELAKLHLDVKSLQAIFVTHVHGDHTGGAGYLRSATGAKIYAGANDAPLIRAGQPRDAFFSTFYMPHHEPHPTDVDVELHGGEQFDYGDVRVQVIAAPGHTPGSTCYLVERRGLRILFSGDVIMNYTERPLGTYSTYLAPRYRGDAADYLTTLHKLRALPVPDLLLPGHPSANAGPSNPRLTATGWAEMLDAGVQEMERLLARYAADGSNFLDGQPKRLLDDLYYFGDFQGVAVYGFFSGAKFFVVNAPGGPGLYDFIEAGRQQLELPPTVPTAVLLTECGEREAGGLRELVERTNSHVVAAPGGIDSLRENCPSETVFCPTDELPGQGWFDVTTIPQRGRGLGSVAYLVRWSGKGVLLSGRIPAIIDQVTLPELSQDLVGPHGSPRAYVDSLRKLVDRRPDLWLPAVPHNCQSANYYDNAWKELLEKNYRAVSQLLQQP